MMEDVTMTSEVFESSLKQKICTPFAKMIVGGSLEKPCYSIMYFDPTDKMFHIGFSSFCLPYVFQWYHEEFEIIEDSDVEDELMKVCLACGTETTKEE